MNTQKRPFLKQLQELTKNVKQIKNKINKIEKKLKGQNFTKQLSSNLFLIHLYSKFYIPDSKF
jgi:DNA-binding protein YbaB